MNGAHVEFKNGQRTYWKDREQREGYDKYGQYKKIDEVPVIEMENAMMLTIQRASSIPKENLIVETARRLGFDRTGPRIREALEEVVMILLRSNRIELRGDRLVPVQS